MLQYLKWRNKSRKKKKEKKNVFGAHFHKDFSPRPLMTLNLTQSFARIERHHKVA